MTRMQCRGQIEGKSLVLLLPACQNLRTSSKLVFNVELLILFTISMLLSSSERWSECHCLLYKKNYLIYKCRLKKEGVHGYILATFVHILLDVRLECAQLSFGGHFNFIIVDGDEYLSLEGIGISIWVTKELKADTVISVLAIFHGLPSLRPCGLFPFLEGNQKLVDGIAQPLGCFSRKWQS